MCVGDEGCPSWGAVIKMGLQVGVIKVGCSSWGVPSRAVQVECSGFLVSICRLSKPPHYVKVTPFGED
jgi:hypothetical protein